MARRRKAVLSVWKPKGKSTVKPSGKSAALAMNATDWGVETYYYLFIWDGPLGATLEALYDNEKQVDRRRGPAHEIGGHYTVSYTSDHYVSWSLNFYGKAATNVRFFRGTNPAALKLVRSVKKADGLWSDSRLILG